MLRGNQISKSEVDQSLTNYSYIRLLMYMRALFIFPFLLILLVACNRPLHIKDRHFDCQVNEYRANNELRKLLFVVMKRAVVQQKDIPDYRLLWNKSRIYVSNKFLSSEIQYDKIEEADYSYLTADDIPIKISNVSFCLKSQQELQKIADRTWEDFLHLSFGFIELTDDQAKIEINNTWISSKHSKKAYLSGGGYTLLYIKKEGEWEFEQIVESWSS